MKEVFDYLQKSGVWFLATVENGQPHLRPFGSIRLYRDRLYFLTGRGKAVSRQLHTNPRVELCAIQGDEWLRVEGGAVLDTDLEAHAALAAPGALYIPDNDFTELWYLRNCTASLYHGAELMKTWRF